MTETAAPTTAAEKALAVALAKRDALMDAFSGPTGHRLAALVLTSLVVRVDGLRRVVADVPDSSDAVNAWARQLTAQVLDDAAPGHFRTAVIEQRSDTRAVLHLAPLAGEIADGSETWAQKWPSEPVEAPMTEVELAAWLEHRGVQPDGDMAQWITEYLGKTLSEMDAIYDAMHGDMA